MYHRDRDPADGFGPRPASSVERDLDQPYGPRSLGAATDHLSSWIQPRLAPGTAAAVDGPVALSSSGAPLAPDQQARMEAGFGTDFSSVRVHEDPAAASAIGAQAFAQGEQVVVGAGGARDDRLIGHELAHVVQQRAGRVASPQGKDAQVVVDAGLEAEADAAADRVVAGGKAELPVGGGTAPARGPVQGYAIRTPDDGWTGLVGEWRVAEDGTLAVMNQPPPGPRGVANPKGMFATRQRIQEGNEALITNGSPYRLEAGDLHAEGPAPDGRGGPQELVNVRMVNTLDDSETTPKQCNTNMAYVLGQKRYVPGTTGQLSVVLGPEPTVVRNDRVDDTVSPTQRGLDEAFLKERYARRHRANEFANPEIGDAIGIRGQNGFGGHFAGVIAKATSGDYVTLENDAAQSGTGEEEQRNPNWYFRMYGPLKKKSFGRKDRSQTFYSEQKRTGFYSANPFVYTLRRREVDQTDAIIDFLQIGERGNLNLRLAPLRDHRQLGLITASSVDPRTLVSDLRGWIRQMKELTTELYPLKDSSDDRLLNGNYRTHMLKISELEERLGPAIEIAKRWGGQNDEDLGLGGGDGEQEQQGGGGEDEDI